MKKHKKQSVDGWSREGYREVDRSGNQQVRQIKRRVRGRVVNGNDGEATVDRKALRCAIFTTASG
jgi:hypothetical protein